MIVCPVCEHPQAHGFECDVCGRQLSPSSARDVPVERMLELQPTMVVDSSRVRVDGVLMPELETTGLQQGRIASLPPEPVPDLETLRAQPVNVRVERLPDLDLHRAPEVPWPPTTAAPGGPVTCRYCRNVQATGMLCDRCGMRLPRVTPSAAAPQKLASDEAPIVRHACGVKTPAGGPCTSCGVFVPVPE